MTAKTMHMPDPVRPGMRFAHARQIVGSPRAGTARPDVCTVTRVTRESVYYRNESGMLFVAYLDRASVDQLPGTVLS